VSARVWPRTAELRDGRLQAVGGVAVAELADRFGTPLWVLDRAELVGRMREYREAFGPDVAVTYAAKALCVTAVLQLAAQEGLHVDVASAGELATARRAGVPMERVVFHGNNKSEEELRIALDVGVGRIVADSFVELDRLSALVTTLGVSAPVVLRVTPGVEAHTHEAIRTGQDDSKFGFTLRAGLAHRAVERALALPGIDLRGVHCHVGSQIFTPEAFDAVAEAMVGFLADVRDAYGFEIAELNAGGGLGIAYTDEDDPPPLAAHAERLHAALARETARRGVRIERLAVEPGRSIAGPAGVTLYRVGTVKSIPDVRTYVSVDGGMSDNPRHALYGARYTVAPAGPPGSPLVEPDRYPDATAHDHVVTLVGKHCESGDVLARDVVLPADLAEGELLAVAATGAYHHGLASNYNRLPRPAMVLVGDGEAQVIVRRETLDDLLALDLPLRN
jgi:diaminopimelate decarboxylase